MKKYFILLLLSFSLCPTWAQMRWNSQYQTYINQYKDLAIQQMKRYHIPASITLAQGLFESRAGLSDLVVRGNNHFGIKCHGWTGGSVYHDDDQKQECFRAYRDAYESYEDHSRFLSQNSRYQGWAYGLKACGYATNPRYASKLIEIIELYKLYEYDRARNYDKFMAKRSGVEQPVGGQKLHPIHIYNKNYYLVARDEDTFKSIGKEVELPYRDLAKYNERDKKDTLRAGDIVYLKKKRKKADKVYKNRPHTVRSGESMYDIAQKYGIRLKSLYKKNHLSLDYLIHVGDQLKVY